MNRSPNSEKEERPKKRRSIVGSATPEISSSSTVDVSPTHFQIPSEFSTILVLVSPLRRKQGEILQRNLIKGGADILDPADEKWKSSNHTPLRLLVVTDDADKARARLRVTSLKQSDVTFVSVKWASAVLAAQAWVPLESYVLRTAAPAGSTKTTISPKTCTRITSGKDLAIVTKTPAVRSTPVWYSRELNERSDISDKVDFMKSLPPYLCQRCTITQSIFPSPNRRLTEILEQVAQKRLLELTGGDSFTADIRARAYRRASSALKCVPYELKTAKDVEWLHSFGPRVLAVANEYIKTGTVAEAELLRTDERLKALSDFAELYGVGHASARKFYDDYALKNVTELRESIRKEPTKFSDVLVQYLAHYDGFRRITRCDVEAFKDLVEDIVNEPGERNLHLRFMICGGFRRGETTGHDVDLLYCRRGERRNDHNSVLEEVVHRLSRRGLIAAVLRLSSDRFGWGEVHYHHRSESFYPYAHDVLHAIAEFRGYKFRLDVVGVRDATEFCFATLAWSGSTLFQRDIRLFCENEKGWTFSQHGVFHQESGKRVELDPLPQSEIDVFNAIGLTYRPPFERSC